MESYDFDNSSWGWGNWSSEGGERREEEDRVLKVLYILVPVALIALCSLSVGVNLVLLGSTLWVRRPLSPTLHISLSLASADMYTCFIVGLGLALNSLLPHGLGTPIVDDCFSLFLEALRMGGMFTTMGHLLALAANHYLGIRRPLHYPSIVTHGNISVVAFFLWIVPSTSFLAYFKFMDNDGFAHPNCTHKFLMHTEFRSGCSYIFLGCLAVMAAIYTHIYALVRRHQAARNRFRRVGSAYARSSQQQGSSGLTEQQETRNEKALCTTLLIVGSVVLGWLPATTYFYLVCEDCFISPEWGSPILVIITNSLINLLLILKTALNSYIYAARMHEIKAAIKRMRMWARGSGRGREESRDLPCLNSEYSRNQLLSRTSTKRRGGLHQNNNSLRRSMYSTPL